MPERLDTPRVKRVDAQSLSELAYNELRASIIDGRIPQGKKLVEAQLSVDLGISRAPIREAMRRLVDDGLVIDRPRRGSVVREILAQDFVDIYNMRIAIESVAVRLIIQLRSDLEDLEMAIEDMRVFARAGDAPRTVAAEVRFHELLCDKSENPYLADTFERLAAQIQMALAIDDSTFERLEDVASEHQPVVDTLRGGDEAEAVRCIESHILSTADTALARLEGERKRLLRARD